MTDVTFQGATPSYPSTTLVVSMGAGAVSASSTQRTTLASDDPAVAGIGGTSDAAATAGSTGSLSAKLRAISRDLIANIVLAAGANVIGGVTIADGSSSTLGAKADAKSAATDTTAVSVVSLLKQLSAYLGGTLTVGSHAVTNAGTFAVQEADGANTTLGSKADAKSTATDTTSITVMQVLKQISASVQAPPSQPVTNTGTFAAQAAITAASGSISSGAIASGAVASGAFASGAIGSGAVASGAIASGAVASGAFASGSIAAGAVAAGATSFVKLEDVASADADAGVPAMAVRKATPANTSGTDGDYEMHQMSGGYLWVHDNKGLSNLVFSAAFTTLTRPANTTAYTAADSISNNATAGSVTALSATVSDTNNDPIFISDILVSSTDTGLAGKKLRAYLYNSDPTASSGVSGGDNAAFSQKVAGYIGAFMGYMETGFSDGTVGRLVPSFNETNFSQAGGFVPAVPTSGAKTLYIQYQAVEAFTPSGSSTTIIGTARGWQGRAA